MVKLKKGIIVSLLAASCLTSGIGASLLSMTAPVKASAATLMDTEDEFMLGSWVSFYNTTAATDECSNYEDQVADLAASGLNYIPHPHWSAYNSTMGGDYIYNINSAAETRAVDDIYGKWNMQYSVWADSNTAERVSIAQELVNCNSYFVSDEHAYGNFQTTADLLHQVYDADPTRFSFCNMRPSYMDLGGVTHEKFLRDWIEMVGVDKFEYLGIDYYPFSNGFNGGTYFTDMELQRALAVEYGGLKTGGFTQLGSFNNQRLPNASEVKWNINTMLAYGYKMINHFNWVAPYNNPNGESYNQDSPRTCTGETTGLYAPTQKLNWQTRQIGNVLMNMNCVGAYHSGPAKDYMGATVLDSSFMVQPTDATQTLIISHYVSKDGGTEYIGITNNSPFLDAGTKMATYTSTFNLNSGIKGLTRYDVDSFDTLPSTASIQADTAVGAPTETYIDTSSSHQFSVTLAPGDFKLFKVDGNVTTTPITEPTVSLESGTYVGEQELTFTAGDANTKIYYTTDGSYPTKSTNLYTGTPIKIGNGNEEGRVTVRYTAYKGEQQTSVQTLDYVLLSSESSKTSLLTSSSDWTAQGGTWALSGGKITQTATGGTWDTTYTYTKQKYKDFVLEGDITITGGSGAGFVGFGVGKTNVSDVQSSKAGEVYAALYDDDGTDNARTFFWQNQVENLGNNEFARMSFKLKNKPTYKFRVVAVGDTICVSVDGEPAQMKKAASYDRDAGYISIVSGNFSISVSNLTIAELDATTFASNAVAKDYVLDDSSVEEVERIAVEKGTAIENVGLPTTTTVKDTEGNSYTVGIEWDCPNYKSDVSNAYTFIGTLVLPPELGNYNGTTLSAKVLVKYDFDKTEMYETIAVAKACKAEDYTASSYNSMLPYLTAAENLVADEWARENDVLVARVQLQTRIDLLVYVGDLRAAVTKVSGLDLSGYTQGTDGIAPALATANATLAKEDATAAEVAAATDELLAAQYALKTAVTESFTVAGMSIRTGAPEGLRFVATMSSAMKTQYASAKFGMMILPADLDTQKAWTVSYDGTAYTADNDALVIEMGEWWSSDLMSENALSGAAYSCALVGDTAQFPEDFYNRPMTAVAFVIGDDEVVYSAKVTRSIAYVAKVESMKADYTQIEVVDRIANAATLSMTVGGDNMVKYGSPVTPVVKLGGVDATASSLVSVTYASANESILAIENQQVKVIGNGTTTITATVTVGSKTMTTSVEVTGYGLQTDNLLGALYKNDFEDETTFTHSNLLNTGAGSTGAIITEGAISGNKSVQFTTAAANTTTFFNEMASSTFGAKNGITYIASLRLKIAQAVAGGEVWFRLHGANDPNINGIKLMSDGTIKPTENDRDSRTTYSYDAATGVITLKLYMTATADGQYFQIASAVAGTWALIIDDISITYAPYYEEGFEWMTTFSGSDAFNSGDGATGSLATGADAITGNVSAKFTSKADAGDWNVIAQSTLGGIPNGTRFLVRMSFKYTSTTNGTICFRLLGTDSVNGLFLNVTDGLVTSIGAQSDTATEWAYDAATGVYTVGVYMTATTADQKFVIQTVTVGTWTITVDDVSFAKM